MDELDRELVELDRLPAAIEAVEDLSEIPNAGIRAYAHAGHARGLGQQTQSSPHGHADDSTSTYYKYTPSQSSHTPPPPTPQHLNPVLFQPQPSLSSSHHHHLLQPLHPGMGTPMMATTTQPDGLLHGSPQSMYAPIQRRSSEMGYGPGTGTGTNSSGTGTGSFDSQDALGMGMEMREDDGYGPEGMRKRKRASMPLLPVGGSGSSGSSSSGYGMGVQGQRKSMSAVPMLQEGQGEERDGRKAKGKSGSGSAGAGSGSHGGVNPALTSCEACRKGKRRCEPSPLVPPSHPDAAKLPCARCRRFALECVRVKVTRRKGPAPVDLSAISDAVHGYTGPTGQSSDSIPNTAESMTGLQQQQMTNVPRRQSSAPSGQALQDPSSRSASFASPAFPLLAVSPSLSVTGIMPDNLDQVVSGPVIDTIINLFFDYVYPLTPCLHRPTFVANLTARRDKTDPLFFALVLTVLASTLVQVPRSLVNLDKMEVESLARRCVRVARAKAAYIYEEPVPVMSTLIVISYLEGIVHLLLGNNTAHVIATAQANQLALSMRLNEEASYDNLDPIESEMRRRMYWLLFQADKSTACLRARTICLRLEDAAALRLPTEVDDEQITPNGIMPQPPGKTPLISGFNINTNLFRILNDALLLQRRRTPPTVESVLADLHLVNDLREKVMRTTLEVADPLLLRTAYDSRVASPAHDWESKLQERFLNYFQAPGDGSHALNSFLVMQGNILVTQHLVRLVLLQTRENLLAQLALLTQMPAHSVGGMAGLHTAEAPEDIACELLDGLNSLPVECVATNGPSLVQKVRFVAIQLMECSATPSPTTARAQKLLMQFLSVLGVIEGMYTFGRDISAE